MMYIVEMHIHGMGSVCKNIIITANIREKQNVHLQMYICIHRGEPGDEVTLYLYI